MLSKGVRIWVCLEPVDMRLSFDGLAARIQYHLRRDPFGGECFVFRSKDRTRLKALLYDGLGFWLHYRRLEASHLVWPAINERGVMELSQAQWTVLTDGLDWRRVQIPERVVASIA